MKKQQIKAGVASLLFGFVAPVAMLVPSVSAADISWNGSVDNTTAFFTNWDGGSPPSNLDNAIFPASANVQDIENDLGALEWMKIIFNGEVNGTSSKSYSITGSSIDISSGIEAIMTGAGGDHAIKTDVNLVGDSTFKTTGSNTLQVGDTGKTLNLGANDLTLQPNGGTITLAGQIDGSGKLIINGTNKINMLAKGATGYTGSVEVTSGTFSVTSETEGNIIVNGGTLKGNSDLLGNVTLASGSVAPGNSPGCFGTADLTFTGGTYVAELEGTDPCTGYDQTAVVGAVNLGTGTTLTVSRLSSFAPADNTAFALILNDGTDAVVGNFLDLADGSTFTLDGYTYQINYNGGDGNDVILLVTGTPTAPDTGTGSLLTSPLMALIATCAALSVVGGIKLVERRRK